MVRERGYLLPGGGGEGPQFCHYTIADSFPKAVIPTMTNYRHVGARERTGGFCRNANDSGSHLRRSEVTYLHYSIGEHRSRSEAPDLSFYRPRIGQAAKGY